MLSLRGSTCERVELNGARITDLEDAFFNKEFYVEFSICSVKGS
jgi:hypothetical protein